MNKVGKEITPEAVKETPWYLKKIINIFTPERIKELAQVNGYVAKISKQFFDDIFGKDNYTIIAIGRSVASIAENIKQFGVDTKIIPLSNLRHGLPENINNVEIYKKYLKSVNLDEESINKNPDRKFILFDYSYSGNTLNATKKFFNEYIFLERKKNLISVSLNEILETNHHQQLLDLFEFNRLKLFSPVGKLPIWNLEKCFEQSDPKSMKEYNSLLAKTVRNLFLYNLPNKNTDITYLYPEKEMQMINEHYYSSKAIKARIDFSMRSINKLLNQFKNQKQNLSNGY